MPTGVYYGANGKARKVKNFYVGVLSNGPVYQTIRYEWNNDVSNFLKFFSGVPQGDIYTQSPVIDVPAYYDTSYFSTYGMGLILKTEDLKGKKNGYTEWFYAAGCNMTVDISFTYITEPTYDHFTLEVKDQPLVYKGSGNSQGFLTFKNQQLSKNDVIRWYYYKDGSNDAANEMVGVYIKVTSPSYIEEKKLISTEQQEVAKKVISAYIGIRSRAKQFFPFPGPITVTYTGRYTTEGKTIDGKKYTLWTLLTSGTLTSSGMIQVWQCGGGADGGTGDAGFAGGGGGGGGSCISFWLSGKGTPVSVIIGSANGYTSTSSTTSGAGVQPYYNKSFVDYAAGGAGGSGGGSSGRVGNQWTHEVSGRGTRDTTAPFREPDLFSPLCSGGGGGGAAFYTGSTSSSRGCEGWDGGYDGSDGKETNSRGGINIATVVYGGAGDAGAGNGGDARNSTTAVKGGSATKYGCGGGGGAFRYDATDSTAVYSAEGGSGYQGVVMLLVPVYE